MKTKLKDRTIDWGELFNISTHHREVTSDFAEGVINGKQWIFIMYNRTSKNAAKDMIKEFGVKGTRRRAKIWVNRVCC